MVIPTVSLNTGAAIPQFGYGTYKIPPAETAEAVTRALEAGYRHIDTAQMYGNEAEVGEALAASGLERDDVFVTTKLNNTNHLAEDARRSIDQSLTDLQLDYVDLFLIHWPLPTLYGGDFVSTWKVMEEFYAAGRAKAIGLSNFQPHHLEAVLAAGGVVPAVNQVEVHPYFPNDEVRAANAAAGIVTEAWSPLGRGGVVDDPVLRQIGDRLGATPAQVALAWHLERGDVVFPKSVTPSRIAENLDAVHVSLSPEDIVSIASLDRGEEGRSGSHPDTMNRL